MMKKEFKKFWMRNWIHCLFKWKSI